MNCEFKRMYDKINFLIKNTDSDFAQVNSQFEQVKMTISNLSVRFNNSKISQVHQKIQAVQIFEPLSDLNNTVTLKSSEDFSMKINTFLNINNDSKLL